MHHFGLGMQMVNCLGDLDEDFATFVFLHVNAQLDIVEEIHAGHPVRDHFNVVVDVVFEKVGHFYYVGVLESISPQVVKDVDFKWDGA